jgi:2-polyprenyl-6-methoxyphenol hydroxylase-like FAD-dependent oxidoreductase
MSSKVSRTFKAIVIGGSLGGLFTGNILRSIGWEVDIYERSLHDLDSRGGGIVLQPDVVELFNQVDAALDVRDLGVLSQDRIVLSPNGSIQSRNTAYQIQTSWSLIYKTLREHFGTEHYHQGKTLVDIEHDGQKVRAIFDDNTSQSGDLLVGADGGRSTVRNIVNPGNQPKYAGYIAWRGLVEEKDVPEISKELLGHFSFASNTGSHILGYLVPGDNNSVEVGKRFYNWVWYRTAEENTELPDIMTDRNGKIRGYSVPPGELQEKWHKNVYQEAELLLPPQFRAMVQATKMPFAQAILDLTSPRMVNNRVLLVGDAAFIPRPHTAASTSKAAANALALGEALSKITASDEIDQALLQWEPMQLRLGFYLYTQGTQAGNHLMFRQ